MRFQDDCFQNTEWNIKRNDCYNFNKGTILRDYSILLLMRCKESIKKEIVLILRQKIPC